MTTSTLKAPDVIPLSRTSASTPSGTRGQQGQAVRAVQPRRRRHRRCHPLLSRRESPQRTSAAIQRPTGSSSTPRRAGSTSRTDLRRAARRAANGQAVVKLPVPVPDPGPNARRDQEVERGDPADIQILQYGGSSTSPGARCGRSITEWRGSDGLEVFGTLREGEEIRAAILDAGKDLRYHAGRLARRRDEHAQSGWIPPRCRRSTRATG